MPEKKRPYNETSTFSITDHVTDGTQADDPSPGFSITNPDTRTSGCTSKETSWTNTVVLADVAYGAGGFKPAPYRYEKATVYLSGEAAALKQEMNWLYQSQDGNLYEGVRHTFSELPREENHLRILDWQEHEGWNE